MATETISIRVAMATRRDSYRAAPPGEKRKMEAVVFVWLKEIWCSDIGSLRQIMKEVGGKAQQRGMTRQLLESTLRKD